MARSGYFLGASHCFHFFFFHYNSKSRGERMKLIGVLYVTFGVGYSSSIFTMNGNSNCIERSIRYLVWNNLVNFITLHDICKVWKMFLNLNSKSSSSYRVEHYFQWIQRRYIIKYIGEIFKSRVANPNCLHLKNNWIVLFWLRNIQQNCHVQNMLISCFFRREE